jgi:hypothetical protein
MVIEVDAEIPSSDGRGECCTDPAVASPEVPSLLYKTAHFVRKLLKAL